MRMARTRISDCTMRPDENDRLYDENDLLYVENELLNNADLYQQRRTYRVNTLHLQVAVASINLGVGPLETRQGINFFY